MKSEFALIEALKKKIPRSLQGDLGIGDDADTLAFKGRLVVTADTIVDGVDFISHDLKPEMAGRKALAVNLSDIAAMGAEPLAFTIALGIPKGFKESWVLGFYKGLVNLAARYKVKCLGGDITKADQFFTSITLIGRAPARIVTRSGARNGDWIGVTGFLGGSILKHHYAFKPRVAEGMFLAASGATSMIDVSDGFLQDLGHVLKASGGGAALETCAVPVSAAALKMARKNYSKAWERALSDGEDFELLFTVPASKKAQIERGWQKKFAQVPLSWLGRVTPRKQKIEWACHGEKLGQIEFEKKGYAHF